VTALEGAEAALSSGNSGLTDDAAPALPVHRDVDRPGLPEAVWFESRRQEELLLGCVVACFGFGFGRRDVADLTDGRMCCSSICIGLR